MLAGPGWDGFHILGETSRFPREGVGVNMERAHVSGKGKERASVSLAKVGLNSSFREVNLALEFHQE
jgi:hypothetical protein